MDKKSTFTVKQTLPDKEEDPEMSAGLAEALGCYVMQKVIAILSISFYYSLSWISLTLQSKTQARSLELQ
jgi:hypothetical protein